jgi:hypothetical protein
MAVDLAPTEKKHGHERGGTTIKNDTRYAFAIPVARSLLEDIGQGG